MCLSFFLKSVSVVDSVNPNQNFFIFCLVDQWILFFSRFSSSHPSLRPWFDGDAFPSWPSHNPAFRLSEFDAIPILDGLLRHCLEGHWHTIHGTSIFTFHEWLTFMVNGGQYTIHGYHLTNKGPAKHQKVCSFFSLNAASCHVKVDQFAIPWRV